MAPAVAAADLLHKAPPSEHQPSSLRRTLLLGILLPVFGFVLINTVVLYRQALAAADTAYDRTLLATAKSLGEQLEVVGEGSSAHIKSSLLYSALEAFEADNRSRLFYRVSGFSGELVSGFEDLPAGPQTMPSQKIYAALVHFYDDEYRGVPVRMAVLLQPVAGLGGQGMATIQVAETLELRETLARQILLDTLWRQAVLVLVIAWWWYWSCSTPHDLCAHSVTRWEHATTTTLRPCLRRAHPANCCRCWTPPTSICFAWPICWTTKRGSCATPRTNCARHWRY
jgi:hypothetical protein